MASAANEHDDEMNPKNVAGPTLLAPASPIDRFIRSCVTNTWMIDEMK